MKRPTLLALIVFTAAVGRTIIVPDSAATIQAGLAAAGYGDTVLVMPDTWYENIVWPGVDGIVLISAAGPESTVVDAQYAGTCLTIGSGSLTRQTVVRGFTFAHGFSASGGAAGISCAGSASIVGNRVTRCNGVGIHLSSYSGSFKPLVRENEIDGCFKEIVNYNYGCGIYISAENAARPEICFNRIHHDTLRNSSRNYGGGIYCDANALIYGNTIEANVLLSDTGTSCRAYGAGIFVDMNCTPLIFSNLIIDNRCETDAWKYGAGIRLYLGAKPVIINNTIVGNVCAGPHMWSNGGGIYSDMRCTSYVKNNIIAGNRATSGSGIFNYTTTQNGLVVSSHNDYHDNDLVGCTMGPGDITLDPRFAVGPGCSYYLSHVAAGQGYDSPCIDAGDTLTSTMPLNQDSLLHAWTTRTDSGYDIGDIDMGYHYPAGVMVGIAAMGRKPLRPVVSAVPNPFQDRVRFILPATGRACLTIADPAGRIVCTLSGSGRFGFDGLDRSGQSLPAGVYFWRVAGAGIKTGGRLVKLE
jgi:predicted outer membrane repeat protein